MIIQVVTRHTLNPKFVRNAVWYNCTTKSIREIRKVIEQLDEFGCVLLCEIDDIKYLSLGTTACHDIVAPRQWVVSSFDGEFYVYDHFYMQMHFKELVRILDDGSKVYRDIHDDASRYASV